MKTMISIFLCLFVLSVFAQTGEVKTGVYRWSDRPVKQYGDRESGVFLEGTTPHFEYLKIHATTQYPGAKPSPEHANKDMEELVIVKEGTMKATIDGQTKILGAGSVLLILPEQMQSFANAGNNNLSYYALKYKSKKPMNIIQGLNNGGSMMLNADSLLFKTNARGGRRDYFDRPTAMCEKMEMHVTQLNQKGPSHEPHSHLDTEIILVISGETEMTIDGKEYTAGPGDFYLVSSELFHGVRNATDKTCSYFAFRWY